MALAAMFLRHTLTCDCICAMVSLKISSNVYCVPVRVRVYALVCVFPCTSVSTPQVHTNDREICMNLALICIYLRLLAIIMCWPYIMWNL